MPQFISTITKTRTNTKIIVAVALLAVASVFAGLTLSESKPLKVEKQKNVGQKISIREISKNQEENSLIISTKNIRDEMFTSVRNDLEFVRRKSFGRPKVIIMMVHWVNSPYEGDIADSSIINPMISHSGMEEAIVKSSREFIEYSYNKFSPRFDICEVNANIEMPLTREEAFNIAVDLCDPEINYSNVDLLILHPTRGNSAFVGSERINTDEGIMRKDVIYLDGPVITHEMGHWLLLPHAHALDCYNVYDREGCEYIRRGNGFDTMGQLRGSFNCALKEQLGWMNPIQYDVARSSYSLNPIELNKSGSCLAISLGSNAPEYCQAIYVEYRRPAGSVDEEYFFGRTNVFGLDRNGELAVYCVAWNDRHENVGSTILNCSPSSVGSSSFFNGAIGLGEKCSIPNLGLSIVYQNYNSGVADIRVLASKKLAPPADIGGDVTPPSGSVIINDDVRRATTNEVSLRLSCHDNVVCENMRIRNEGEGWASFWTPYAESSPWNLVGENGIKKVYAQYKDPGGRISAEVFDSILMETPPDTVIDSSPPLLTSSTSATFEFHSENGGEHEYAYCKLDNNEFSSCSSPKEYMSISLGNHTFLVRASANALTDPSPASYSWVVNDVPSIQYSRQYESSPGRQRSPGFTDRDGMIVIEADIIDRSPGGMAKFEVEIRPIGTEFTNTATHITDFVMPDAYSNLKLTISDLNNGSYHWQIRAMDSMEFISNWISFGLNLETDPDFIVAR